MALRVLTLGPSGSCHEAAVSHYLTANGLSGRSEILFTFDLVAGMDDLASGAVDLLVQCSAHPQVHLATERHHRQTPVVDTFIHPTKALALLRRADRPQPRSLGLVAATAGYLDLDRFEHLHHEPSKPVVAEGLLADRYDAGLTHLEHAAASDGQLVVVEVFGEVVTTWVVYGRKPRYAGQLIGTESDDYLASLFHFSAERGL